jgi:class 3 adenylate cyclase/tetratricopeptide (TPR) repeat protein
LTAVAGVALDGLCAEGFFGALHERGALDRRVAVASRGSRSGRWALALGEHGRGVPGVMVCRSCGGESPDGALFCGGCGGSLAEVADCPECGAENPAGQGFCNACGRELSPAASAAGDGQQARAGSGLASDRDQRAYAPPEHLAEKLREARADLDGERKQVTVLFADVIGSMDLAERTDPEVWRSIMDRFFTILCDGVHRFEGTVDKFTGDGIMALFGAPLAHEDHAQRACWAALTLQRELAASAGEVRRGQGLNFSVRMGINSGEVVVGRIGEDLSLEYTAVGHTVGLAQRMESLAEPGRAYLTDDTAKLVAGYLDLEDLGEFDVKGVSEPVRVHALAGAGGAHSRLDISKARGFTRFVGRGDELATLEAALQQARGGSGVVVGVVGEAGVGKSRLCHEFVERCRRRGIPVYEAQGQAHGGAIPFLPVLQMMRSYFHIAESDSDQHAREKIAGRLLLLDEAFAEGLPLVFDFLAVPDPHRPAPRMDPDARQRALLEMVKRLVHTAGQSNPGVYLLEDAHWFDPGTEIFLTQFVEAIQSSRTLAIINFRPEYSAEWMRKSYYRQVSLLPLGEEAIGALLADLLGEDPSLNGLPGLISERTAGNPFFIEEVVRALVESGNLEGKRGAYRLVRPVEDATVPPTVNTVLAARIDRLAEREKSLLQSAAVIGREFTEPVLDRAASLKDGELEPALRALIAAEFLYEQELYPEAVYAFKHPLTQEVAYNSQLGERRGAVHRRVAEALQELYPDKLDERSALLAYHWEAAGDFLAAARWSARAATWVGLSDISEAVRHWRKVSELTQTLPDSAEAIGLALAARLWRLNYGWRLGISEQEAAAHYEAGRELAQRSGEHASLLLIISAYATVRGTAGHVEEYGELAQEIDRLGVDIGDPALRIVSLMVPIYSLWAQGRLGDALAFADEGIALGAENPALGVEFLGLGTCPYAWCVCMRSMLLAAMAYPDEAAAELDRALRVAQEQGALETQGWIHTGYVVLAHYTGEPQTELAHAALSHATQGYEIAERIGSTFSRVLALQYLGYARLLIGEPREAIVAIERSIELGREARTGLEQESLRFAALSEALLSAGDHQRALDAARESVTLARERGNEGILVVSHRVLAEALLAGDGPGRATAVQETLEQAAARAEATGFRAELPFIERARAHLIPAT